MRKPVYRDKRPDNSDFEVELDPSTVGAPRVKKGRVLSASALAARKALAIKNAKSLQKSEAHKAADKDSETEILPDKQIA